MTTPMTDAMNALAQASDIFDKWVPERDRMTAMIEDAALGLEFAQNKLADLKARLSEMDEEAFTALDAALPGWRSVVASFAPEIVPQAPPAPPPYPAPRSAELESLVNQACSGSEHEFEIYRSERASMILAEYSTGRMALLCHFFANGVWHAESRPVTSVDSLAATFKAFLPKIIADAKTLTWTAPGNPTKK